MLALSHVVRRFGGIVAVDDLSLEVPDGRIVGVIGPNGAGKTTILDLITSVITPTSGTITFDRELLVGRMASEIVRLGIARTFQTVRLFRSLTVWEHVIVAQNLRTGFGLGLRVSTEARERAFRHEAAAILDLVGLWEKRDELGITLPLADQRRLEIARALATAPKLLLLDEPAAGMSAVETKELLAVIDSVREARVTMLMTEHDMSTVMNVCDHVVVLSFGRKIAEGRPDEVRAMPEVIEAYLGGGEPAY